ncbi:hypothetical protein TNCT_593031 [Trichonephila clavata]|uniref:Uncharacterized protein n=1 Tax=Trichonephila clavata TaxID=2740835 RepID=A0A8X6III4_TRICU|nr:hypothetical protein TNCT_593031 [Trichonephila clavata]
MLRITVKTSKTYAIISDTVQGTLQQMTFLSSDGSADNFSFLERTEPMKLDLSVRYPNPYCHVELTSGQMTASNRPRQTVSPVVVTHSTFHLNLSA